MEEYQELFIGILMEYQRTEIHQILMKIAKFIVMNYRNERKQIFEIYCNSFEIVIK